MRQMPAPARLVIVPGATHLFEAPGAQRDVRVDFPDYAAACAASLAPPLPRTVSTGHGAFRSTRSATLPITA